ncbi:MAG: hypothetical protein ACLFR5_06960 [Halobacteriales archaeon]
MENDGPSETDRLYARVVLQTVAVAQYAAWVSLVFYTTTVFLLAGAAYVVGAPVGYVFVALAAVALYRLVTAVRAYKRQRGILVSLRDAGVYGELEPADVEDIETFDGFARLLRERREA